MSSPSSCALDHILDVPTAKFPHVTLLAPRESQNLTPKAKKEKKTAGAHERRSLKTVPLRWAEQAPAEVVKDLSSEEIQQFEIVAELTTTEEHYVKDLSIIIDVFLQPVREKSLLADKERNALFGVVEEIRPLHQEILKELRQVQKLSAKEIVVEVASIFCRRSEQFKIYLAHCPAIADIQGRIDALNTRPDFNKFLQECASKAECRKLLLADFLIAPLQRLVKYPLLLSTLRKHTQEKNAGFKLIKEALDKMSDIAELVNNQMRRITNMKKLAEIKARLEDAEDVELMLPGRELVRELACKIVEKKSRVLDGYLFIFTDMALLCRQHDNSLSVEKELSYISENLPPEAALKASDAQESLLELRYSQWGLHTGRKAISLFIQLATPMEKNSVMHEINKRAHEQFDTEWKAFDMLQRTGSAPTLASLTSSSSSAPPGEGRLDITDQNLFAATSYQDMLKEQVRKLQAELADEKETRQLLQDYAVVLRYRLQRAAKHNVDHTSTDGTVAKAKYKQLKKRFREVSREKTELEKSISKLKTKVPGLAMEETKVEERKLESTTDRIFGLLSPRFKKQDDPPPAVAKQRPATVMLSAPTSPVSRDRAAMAVVRDPRKPPLSSAANAADPKAYRRPVSMKVAFFEKMGLSDPALSPPVSSSATSSPAAAAAAAPPPVNSAPSVVSLSPAATPARAANGIASGSNSASSVSSNTTSSASSVSSSSSASPPPIPAKPVLARIAGVRDISQQAKMQPPPLPEKATLSTSAAASTGSSPPYRRTAKPTAATAAGVGSIRASGKFPPAPASASSPPPPAQRSAFRGATSVTVTLPAERGKEAK